MGLYASRFDVIANNMLQNVDNEMRKLIVNVGERVVHGTPIDTGQARRNWQPRLNQAATTVLDEPSGPAAGQQEAILAIKAMAAQYKAGNVAHITNNLPYIRELNSGSSKQAPAMFVENAILAAVRQFNTKVFR